MKISFTPAALVGSFSNDINFEIHLLLLKQENSLSIASAWKIILPNC
jgi:hypothetical protein